MNVTDENVRPHFLSPLVLSRLVNFNWLSTKLNHVQNLDGIVSILLRLELDEPIALMFICHFVSWYVNIDDRPTLKKQLPHQVLIDFQV